MWIMWIIATGARNAFVSVNPLIGPVRTGDIGTSSLGTVRDTSLLCNQLYSFLSDRRGAND